MGIEITFEELIKNIDRYCWRLEPVIITADISEDDCNVALAKLLKKHGFEIFYTDEPIANVTAIIGSTLVAFAEVTCADNEFYVSRLWCWKRLPLPPQDQPPGRQD
jgi:hypothetical protein